jgi:archaellum component FlaC
LKRPEKEGDQENFTEGFNMFENILGEGCIVDFGLPDISAYLQKMREGRANSTQISDDSKMLIEKLIRYYDKETSKFLHEPPFEIRNINDELNGLKEVDSKIMNDTRECFSLVAYNLKKHSLEPFNPRLLRKPLEQKPMESSVPELAVALSISRVDHCNILNDLTARVNNLPSITNQDREIIQDVVNEYMPKIDANCKAEDEYVTRIKTLAEQVNNKFKPVYDSMHQMHSWIYQFELISDLE